MAAQLFPGPRFGVIYGILSVGNGIGGPKGDPYGRWGNVWTAAHLIQGIPDKTQVTFD